MIKAVILDIDGTLLYSNDAHAQAFVDAARELELEVPQVEEEVRKLIGMGSDKLIPRIFGFEKEEERGRALDERKGDIFRERYLDALSPTPGTRELLERLREDGYRLVVATSASPDDVDGLLKRAGVVRDLIEEATSGDEVDASKPEPDVVHAALREAKVDASEALMIGDTPYDVEASGRAGVPIIALRTGGWDDASLRGALAVYADPADLLAHYGETPLGSNGASQGGE